jgi:hypothetical protein
MIRRIQLPHLGLNYSPLQKNSKIWETPSCALQSLAMLWHFIFELCIVHPEQSTMQHAAELSACVISETMRGGQHDHGKHPHHLNQTV